MKHEFISTRIYEDSIKFYQFSTSNNNHSRKMSRLATKLYLSCLFLDRVSTYRDAINLPCRVEKRRERGSEGKTERKKRAASGKGTEIGEMNYACQESKRGYTCNIDRRNTALRIWGVYAARYRENTRSDATRGRVAVGERRGEQKQKKNKRGKRNTLRCRIFFDDEPTTASFVSRSHNFLVRAQTLGRTK